MGIFYFYVSINFSKIIFKFKTTITFIIVIGVMLSVVRYFVITNALKIDILSNSSYYFSYIVYLIVDILGGIYLISATKKLKKITNV